MKIYRGWGFYGFIAEHHDLAFGTDFEDSGGDFVVLGGVFLLDLERAFFEKIDHGGV